MDARYQHDMTVSLWTTTRTARIWVDILDAVMRAQASSGVIPPSLRDGLTPHIPDWLLEDAKTTRAIRRAQGEAGHEVVGFLDWLTPRLPAEQAQWVYFGMTSSDLMDTAMGVRFTMLTPTVSRTTMSLERVLQAGAVNTMDAWTLGHTHGQPAEPTSLGWQIVSWLRGVQATRRRMIDSMRALQECKLSGPVGTFAHNPPQVERRAAALLGLNPSGSGCGQVIPRHALAYWAACSAQYVRALGKVATDLRLAASRGEFEEGRARDRVGSSAMPAKRNPIQSERVCSFARMATGYEHMLADVDLWEERDLTNSAVERVAVPDLLQVVLAAAKTLRDVLDRGIWDNGRQQLALTEAGRQAHAAWYFNQLIRHGMDRRSAREQTAGWVDGDEWHGSLTHLSDPHPSDFIQEARELTDWQTPGYGEPHGDIS